MLRIVGQFHGCGPPSELPCNDRDYEPVGPFFHGIGFNLFCRVMAATPFTIEGKVPPEACPPELDRKTLAFQHGGYHFRFRRPTFGYPFSRVWM
jgi:hypothetical protein